MRASFESRRLLQINTMDGRTTWKLYSEEKVNGILLNPYGDEVALEKTVSDEQDNNETLMTAVTNNISAEH